LFTELNRQEELERPTSSTRERNSVGGTLREQQLYSMDDFVSLSESAGITSSPVEETSR
jgi:hypothetical protein